MKKRIVAILLVFAMSTFLFACGNESTQPTEPTESTEQQATEEIPTTDIADSTEAEPVEEPTAEQETAESTETEAPTSEPTEEATVQYTYTDLSTTMYAQQTVNVRNQPSTDGEKVGSLSTNQEVSVSGQCNETGWYRIAYGDGEAYVSNKYLGDNKVEVQQSAQNTQTSDNSGGGSNNSSNPCPYTLWEPVDNGDSFSWYVVQPDSNHMDTTAWMSSTLYERARAKSGDFSIQQTTWEFVGTYDEGNVYYQVWSAIYH